MPLGQILGHLDRPHNRILLVLGERQEWLALAHEQTPEGHIHPSPALCRRAGDGVGFKTRTEVKLVESGMSDGAHYATSFKTVSRKRGVDERMRLR